MDCLIWYRRGDLTGLGLRSLQIRWMAKVSTILIKDALTAFACLTFERRNHHYLQGITDQLMVTP